MISNIVIQIQTRLLEAHKMMETATSFEEIAIKGYISGMEDALKLIMFEVDKSR